MTIFETYHSSFRAFNCFFQLNHDMGRRVCGWMFLQKVSTIETKQAAVKNLGADDTGVLGGFDSGPFWESPETQPTIGIFFHGATSCYFCPVPFRIFLWILSSRWNSPSAVFFQSLVWVFPKIGVSQNGRFIMENPIKMGWFGGYHYFRKHPYRC